jgi:hypothetical protein
MAVPTENVSIELGIHSPKKDALVYLGAPTPLASEIAIFSPTGVNVNKVQTLIGTWKVMLAFALNNLAAVEGAVADTVISCLPGGGNAGCQLDGTPIVGGLQLVIGLDSAATGESHFIDRTTKRLLEVWLEHNAAVV